jgi:ubiquinone/menaquinone biosynthesis C-methylase UbiE
LRRLNSFGFTTHKEVSDWYDNKFTEMGGSWYVPAEEIDGLLNKLGDVRGKDCLELGCGDGKLMARILERDGHVTGTDISEVARTMASDKLSRYPLLNWVVVAWPMEALDCPDGVYDFVITYGSMEHSLDIPQAVKEMARVLKSGGRWLNYAPNELWIHEDQPLETTMTEAEWQVLYDAAGLTVESSERNGDNTIYVGYKN